MSEVSYVRIRAKVTSSKNLKFKKITIVHRVLGLLGLERQGRRQCHVGEQEWGWHQGTHHLAPF